ncbi:MAG TPA: hypothetical protein VFZ23_00260 [Pyrinomonadaceae bacterium]
MPKYCTIVVAATRQYGTAAEPATHSPAWLSITISGNSAAGCAVAMLSKRPHGAPDRHFLSAAGAVGAILSHAAALP